MDGFNELIRTADISTKRDKVAFAYYYFDKIQNVDPVEKEDVIQLLVNESRTNVTKNNVHSYTTTFEKEGILKSKSGGFILSNDALDQFSEKFDLSGIEPEPLEEDFLEISYETEFYNSLIGDINKTYHVRVYDATLVLTRKFLESLLIDILRNRYGTDQIDLYYNANKAQFHSFSTLIDNFKNNLDDFRHMSDYLDDDSIISDLNQFRNTANSSAHSITVDISKDEVDKKSQQATKLAKVMKNINENL
jgi:hypothetical protein